MSQLAAFKGRNNISRHTHHSHNFRSKRPFKWLWNSPEVCPRRVSPKKKSCRAGTIRCSPLSASKLPVKGKLLTYQEQPGVQKPPCAVDWPSIRQCKTYIYIYLPLYHVLPFSGCGMFWGWQMSFSSGVSFDRRTVRKFWRPLWPFQPCQRCISCEHLPKKGNRMQQDVIEFWQSISYPLIVQ